MIRYSIFRKSLRDQRWQSLGFGLALMAMSSTSVLLWPSARDALQQFELPKAVQAFLGSKLSIATAAGYLSARYFGWVEILLIVYAVIQGTGAIAGEESAGTIDLLLSQPVRRADIVLQKCVAFVCGLTVAVGLGVLGFAAAIPFVRIDVSIADTAIASANMLPMILLFFAFALWAGAVAPNRGAAAGLSVGVATAAYFINTLATGVESLQNLKYATPFYYYGAGLPLVQGVSLPHVGLLMGATVGLAALALAIFDRRDLGAGSGVELKLPGLLRRPNSHAVTDP